MSWFTRLVVLCCTLSLLACTSRPEARAPDGEQSGWVEVALGTEPDLAVIVRRDQTRRDPAIGHVIEALLALNHAATFCESDPVASEAVLAARELEFYAKKGTPPETGPSLVVLRGVPESIALERSTLYQKRGTAGTARVYAQRRPVQSHALYVFDDGTWIFSPSPDQTEAAISRGSPPRSRMEPGAMVAARLGHTYLQDATFTGVEREVMDGLAALTLVAQASTPSRPLAFGARYHYESEAQAEHAEKVLEAALASGRLADKARGLDRALVAKVLSAFRVNRRGRTVTFDLNVSSEMVEELKRAVTGAS
jgi:hypothetical protein